MIILKEKYQGFDAGEKVTCSPGTMEKLVNEGRAEWALKKKKAINKPRKSK